MEDIFRVSKLEDMIKGNVKIDDFAKLEKKMATVVISQITEGYQ